MRLDLNKSREGFSRRWKGRSFYVMMTLTKHLSVLSFEVLVKLCFHYSINCLLKFTAVVCMFDICFLSLCSLLLTLASSSTHQKNSSWDTNQQPSSCRTLTRWGQLSSTGCSFLLVFFFFFWLCFYSFSLSCFFLCLFCFFNKSHIKQGVGVIHKADWAPSFQQHLGMRRMINLCPCKWLYCPLSFPLRMMINLCPCKWLHCPLSFPLTAHRRVALSALGVKSVMFLLFHWTGKCTYSGKWHLMWIPGVMPW